MMIEKKRLNNISPTQMVVSLMVIYYILDRTSLEIIKDSLNKQIYYSSGQIRKKS